MAWRFESRFEAPGFLKDKGKRFSDEGKPNLRSPFPISVSPFENINFTSVIVQCKIVMERTALSFSATGSHRQTGGKGVSTTAFLHNLEHDGGDTQNMYLDESIIGMEEESHLTKLLRSKLDQLRGELTDFLLVKDKEDIDRALVPQSANIILFGPSGSGKSSVIRTVYTALNGIFNLPPELEKKLIIKQLSGNEGTTKYTRVQVKQPRSYVLKSAGMSYEYKVSGIDMYDTRGQILLDDREKEALNIMMDVCVNHSGKSPKRQHYRKQKLQVFVHALRVLEKRLRVVPFRNNRQGGELGKQAALHSLRLRRIVRGDT